MVIEFRGGAYDGYQQTVDITPDLLEEFVTFPVSSSILNVISGQWPGEYKPVRVMAIYGLQTGFGCTYKYLGWSPTTDREWHDWIMKAIAEWQNKAQQQGEL